MSYRQSKMYKLTTYLTVVVSFSRTLLTFLTVIYKYIYIRVSVGLTKEYSMSYRRSEMYKLTTYLKDLPQQSVSSKKNLQVYHLKILFR